MVEVRGIMLTEKHDRCAPASIAHAMGCNGEGAAREGSAWAAAIALRSVSRTSGATLGLATQHGRAVSVLFRSKFSLSKPSLYLTRFACMAYPFCALRSRISSFPPHFRLSTDCRCDKYG